ncbi:hypothetical protein [Mesorhizobium sp. M0047]|uniref:hypothetical protein n=1 Tax=Mesorhizobium sp. M0047 TaxID=2956859 RepID=UPI0033383DD8
MRAILHGQGMDLVRMAKLSRAMMADIGQNITLTLGLKAVFLVTTIVGGLWAAILARIRALFELYSAGAVSGGVALLRPSQT